MKTLAIFTILFLAGISVKGDDVGPQDRWPRVIKDPTAKITFYLESDQRHIAAISDDGKLLWCIEVMPAPDRVRTERFIGWGLAKSGSYPPFDKGDGCITVSAFVGTMMTTDIDKKTGKVIFAIGQ